MHYILRVEKAEQQLVISTRVRKMGFKRLPNNQGMIYTPECACIRRKNPCVDCFSCQWCSNERCRLCKGKTKNNQKMGMKMGQVFSKGGR